MVIKRTQFPTLRPRIRRPHHRRLPHILLDPLRFGRGRPNRIRRAALDNSRSARLHIHLQRSEPAANETLSVVPKGIHLWFSEPVELAVTAVRLKTADSAAVAVGAVRAGDERPHGNPSVSASIQKTLKPGAYEVTWRTTAKDGHPAKGAFAFVIKPGARASE